MAEPEPERRYKVIDQEFVEGFDRRHGTVQQVRVWFETRPGVTASIVVARDQYEPGTVHQLIEREVDVIEAVASL